MTLLLQIMVFCFAFFGGLWSASKARDAFDAGDMAAMTWWWLLAFLGTFCCLAVGIWVKIS